MKAKVRDGWIVVPFDGPDTAQVFLTVGDERKPAYIDGPDGARVAKVRVPAGASGNLRIQLSVNDVVTPFGFVTV